MKLYKPKKIKCFDCAGNGYVFGLIPCRHCRGTGGESPFRDLDEDDIHEAWEIVKRNFYKGKWNHYQA